MLYRLCFLFVIPAWTGIQRNRNHSVRLDSDLRLNDGSWTGSIILWEMFEFFRLRHSDQRTTAGMLVTAGALLCGYTVINKQETFEPKPYTFRIDLDTATLGELQTLPGIGPKLAENIIQYRNEHAPIHEFDEITNVRGIGAKRFITMKPYFID